MKLAKNSFIFVELRSTHFFASGVIRELIIGSSVQRLLASVDRTQDDFVTDDDVVPGRAQFVEGHDVEPGTLVAGWVEVDSHGVLLERGRKTLVDCQKLVRLDVEDLDDAAVLDVGALEALVFGLVLLLLDLRRVLCENIRKSVKP
jgi:hypothetical protein